MAAQAASGPEQQTGAPTEARDRFARLFDDLCGSVDVSAAQICREIPISSATLSGHRHGSRIPSAGLVASIHSRVSHHAALSGLQVPVTLKDLQLRRAQAVVEQKAAGRSTRADRAAAKKARAVMAASTQAVNSKPAADQQLPQTDVVYPGDCEPPRSVLPVPLPEVDRQHRSGDHTAWIGLEEVTQRLLNGQDRDAHLLLFEAGTTLPPGSVVDVISDVRGAGFAAAADAVLHSAGQREPHDTLRIVKLLNAAGRYDDANLLLDASTGN
ncbi:hypothetical protein KCMC57_up33370 [Kitasatospora sp. CMC57]|uniref:Uncharacterized protein n=1 Tax=Kitasatospora sp. CMC57 TaxID=3231513 RepID=A0AB33JV78_9ACTN